MKFGFCSNMNATEEDPAGIEQLSLIADAGFDYVELPLAQTMSLSESQYRHLLERLGEIQLSVYAFNNFFPVDMRLTGPNVELPRILDYAEKALEKASGMGAQRIVFGSGPAKMVPEGFLPEEGYGQMVRLMKIVGSIARKHGIIIAIEPLRKTECNLINTYREGCRLCEDVADANVRTLTDFYHFTAEQESPEDIWQFAPNMLSHVHFAAPNGRTFPRYAGEANYAPFITAVLRTDYDDGVSLEAYANHLKDGIKPALDVMKHLWLTR